MREKLLNEIINFYLSSSRFNGLPIYDIDEYDAEVMIELINEGMVTNFDIDEVIVNPIKYIRKIRQVPAHELTDNKYDVDVYEKQKELMINTYGAIRAIRILFMGHPLAKAIDIPDYLLQGKDIIFY